MLTIFPNAVMTRAGVCFPASQRQNASAPSREELCTFPPVLKKAALKQHQ